MMTSEVFLFLSETVEETVSVQMTGRKCKDRLKEHVNDIKFNKQTTAITKFDLKQN